jgi:hypothetical protein
MRDARNEGDSTEKWGVEASSWILRRADLDLLQNPQAVLQAGVRQAKARQFERRPSVVFPIGRLTDQHEATNPQEWGRRFNEHSGRTERSGYDPVSLVSPLLISTDHCCILCPYGASLFETEPTNETAKQIRPGRPAFDHAQDDVRPSPSNHQARHAAAGTEVNHKSGRNGSSKSVANDKGPLRIFSERALSIAFLKRREERGVSVCHQMAMAIRPVQ